jgi:hypothetical protein
MNRNIFRIYMMPFLDNGTYSGEWIEVTNDVILNGLGSIKLELDNTEYDVGVFRSSSFGMSLKNDRGLYSDVNILQSIFRYKRADSLVKITWSVDNEGFVCGWTDLFEAYLGDEVEVYRGVLTDESSSFSANNLVEKFKVIGLENLLSREIVPFSSITAGDTFEEILLTCLDQPTITGLLTVSALNIECDINAISDTVAGLQGKTVLEAVKDILLASNSVLYIRNTTIYVSPREETATLEYEFYGQASNAGLENIIDLTDIKTGSQRVINYVTWKDSTNIQNDGDSVLLWGVRKKEITSLLITNSTKRNTSLNAIVQEFKDIKTELKLETKVSYDTLDLFLLDKCMIDYPIQYVQVGNPLPICGIAICGEAILPRGIWSFMIPDTDRFKIMSKDINLKDGTITFGMREV